MTENSLLREITIEEEQRIAGGGYLFDDLKVNIDVEFDLIFNIENLYARSGDQIAIDGGTIIGSSGNVAVGNLG